MLSIMPFNWKNLRIFADKRRFAYLTMCFCILPLLLFSSHQKSLMIHDEGLYAWRAKMMFDSGDWVHPWSSPHHKTPGPYWLIAGVYVFLGVNEISVRLPSLILGIFSMVLVYEIGRIILNHNLAWLGAIILSLEFLWLQYCRLGNPDIPMIFLVLLAIFCLLKSEKQPQKRHLFGFIAGLALGLGFLVRSLMMVLPMIALTPYLITSHKRHHHLFNPYIYLGFCIGLIPTAIWLYINIQDYGTATINQLLGFAVRLSTNERHGNGFLFYLWNVPLKSFPWTFFAIAGGVICWRRGISGYNSILLGFPVAFLLLLTLISTRLSHYSLLLYPFIGLLAAVAIADLLKTCEIALLQAKGNSPRTRFLATFNYGASIFAIACIFAGVFVIISLPDQIRPYGSIAIMFGWGWFLPLLVWRNSDRFTNPQIGAKYWLASLLIPFWLGLATVGLTGLLDDYNPQIKQAISQPIVAQILQRHPINFVKVGGKTGVLLNFYTPRHGSRTDDISQIPHNNYAWVRTKNLKNSPSSHRIIAEVKEYSLIQIQRPVLLGGHD